MNPTSCIKGAGFALAALLIGSSSARAFNANLTRNYIQPLEDERDRQQAICNSADDVVNNYKVFASAIKGFNLGNDGKSNLDDLTKSRDDLQDQINKLSDLLKVKFVSLSGFRKSANPGEYYLVIGKHDFDNLPIIELEDQLHFKIDVDLQGYFCDQWVTTYGFAAYGKKDAVKENTLVSEKGYYVDFEEQAFIQVANQFQKRSEDIAGWYFFGKIIPGLGFAENFMNLDKSINDFKSDLFKVHSRLPNGSDDPKHTFKDWNDLAMQGKTPEEIKKIFWSSTQPPPRPPKCNMCGTALNADGSCPNAGNHPKCGKCGYELVNGSCPNAANHPKCGVCGTELANGSCPNAAKHPKCEECGTELVNGNCPNAANHKSVVQFLKGTGIWILIAVAVVVVLAMLFKRPSQPSQPSQPLQTSQPPPPPPPVCPKCGMLLVDGKCPNCDKSVSTCNRCGEPLVDGKCPKCDKSARKCGICDTPLDKDGICPICTNPNKPVLFHNTDDDATKVPAAFDLEIVAPAKWAGRYVDHLPAKFEMGRYSEDHLPAPGIPFGALNLKNHPEATSCSRNYLRFSMTPSRDGFNVDLLADNYCKVAGTGLRKGENAVAKVGDTIEISPDWVFKVVPRK